MKKPLTGVRANSPRISNAELATAPREAIDIYHRHREEALDAGASVDESHRRGLRHLFHAGWFRKGSKWQQIHPDLRGRITLRDAHRQPDGRYLVEGVPVFYPNAVKGKNEKYTRDDIREIISNTNAAILDGGQKPSLLEGHAPSTPEARNMAQLAGIQAEPKGFGINWRESKKRPGWAECDLIDVDAEYVKKLKDRRLTGLSAYISRDANKLNRRFGHIALLGGSTQALSYLPTLEVFDSFSDSACCFAADDGLVFSHSIERKIMPLSLKHKGHRELMDSLRDSYDAYTAAEASHEAGEPGAEQKIGEADARFNENCKAFADAMQGGGEETPVASPTDAPGGEQMQPEADQGAPAFEDEPAAAFEAEVKARKQVARQLTDVLGRLNESHQQNVKMTQLVKAMGEREASREFESFFDGLTKKRHSLPKRDEVFANHIRMVRAGDVDGIRSLKSMLSSTPKQPVLSDEPTQFAGGEGDSFSAEDIAQSILRVQRLTGIGDTADSQA